MAAQTSEKLAIKGGTPLRERSFHHWPVYDDGDLANLNGVLKSPSWGGFGPKVREFESAFSQYHGALDGVAVTNGTVTLTLCLRAIGIKPGDEVIIPGLTWIGTATAVLDANGVPVMVDVDPETSCIDPRAIVAAITPRTVAIMPVHLYGCMADMDAISNIAERYGLAVIEDCAHAHGAAWKGKSAGSIGTLGSFSFQMSKVMTAGEGGAVIGRDRSLLDKVHSLRNCGRHAADRGAPIMGGNHRMTEWQGAILLGQLSRLDSQLAKREENLRALKPLLADVPAVSLFEEQESVTQRPWYRLGLHYDKRKAGGIPLVDFVKAVNAEGLPAERTYAPVYGSTLYQTENMTWYPGTVCHSKCDVAEDLMNEKVLNLPHELFLGSQEDMVDIVRVFKKVLARPEDASNIKSRLKAKAKGIIRRFK